MRLVRWPGENVSPSDDGRLYEKIFGDGLLADVDMTPAGAAKINIGPIYGIICGREFTTDATTINAALPSSGTKYGTIYAEIDTSKSSPLSIKTSISQSWTPTRQDINVSGNVAQVAIGWYGATPTAVTQAESNWPIEGENGVLKRATVREVLERLYYMATNHQNTISGLTTEVTRLNNDLTTVSTRVAWTNPVTQTITSVSDFTSWVDARIASNGFLFGYLDYNNATGAGLINSHAFIVMSNSTQNRLVVAFRIDGKDIAILSKQGGIWASEWKSVTLS